MDAVWRSKSCVSNPRLFDQLPAVLPPHGRALVRASINRIIVRIYRRNPWLAAKQ